MTDGRSAADVADALIAIADADARRAARLGLRDEMLLLRLRARQAEGVGRLADALAKFGGGSLLTATLLLIIGGQVRTAVLGTAMFALSLFVAATILWSYNDRRAARLTFQADRLDAALKETERTS